MERVLVIGNGFDLDLGLKTNYCNFFNSDHFPNSKFNGGLISSIRDKLIFSNWIDLEKEIKTFCIQLSQEAKRLPRVYNIEYFENIKNDFTLLTNGLNEYINTIDYSQSNTNSTAAKLLKIFVQHFNGGNKIITFNYTPILDLVNQFSAQENRVKIKHVHGSVKQNNIIIGIEDDVLIHDQLCFTIKSHNFHYESSNVRRTISNAHEIIFFGHSLGASDYHYFQDFFQEQVKPKNDICKKITIFTHNEKSKLDILLQLRNMNNNKTNHLFDNNEMKILCTGDKRDQQKIESYLKSLDNDLKPKDLSNLIY